MPAGAKRVDIDALWEEFKNQEKHWEHQHKEFLESMRANDPYFGTPVESEPPPAGIIGDSGNVKLDMDNSYPDRGKTYIIEFCQEVQESINRMLNLVTNIEAYPLLQYLDPLIDAQLSLAKFNKLEDRLEDVRLHEAYNTAKTNLDEISKQIDTRMAKRARPIADNPQA